MNHTYRVETLSVNNGDVTWGSRDEGRIVAVLKHHQSNSQTWYLTVLVEYDLVLYEEPE